MMTINYVLDIDEELARIQAAKKRLADGTADGGVPLGAGEHTPYMDRQLYNSTSKNKFAGYVTSIPASDDVDADVSTIYAYGRTFFLITPVFQVSAQIVSPFVGESSFVVCFASYETF